eukprot:TRINITY_DN5781_c0_g1_i4.p1 TRINITY_DN5781_c0_g1~~TRINITY_DN5781_c0_g1_i4.p1  ORF type:complete len:178 (-),score=61.45 TRINITY_DN5781_c0_g1_i4:194-727(-)
MLPQLSSLYDQADDAFDYIQEYTQWCEAQLCKCLRAGTPPGAALMEAIGVGKIRAVETTVQLCFRLKQAVGSYALMLGSGFEWTDTMQIAKFAEGESFVLMQKLARDRVKNRKAVDGTSKEEEALCAELRGVSGMEWVAKSDEVYALAELVMDRVMKQAVGSELPRGVARPFALSRL